MAGVQEWLHNQGFNSTKLGTPIEPSFKGHIVPLKQAKRDQFYRPVVLLSALTSMFWSNVLPSHNVRPQQAEESIRSDHTNKPNLRDFINKVCQFCDSKPGGDTVTACVLLQYPGSDHIEYRFASNQRNAVEIEKTKQFLMKVLEIVRTVRRGSWDSARSDLLKLVVGFCRPRIRAYIKAVVKHSQACIATDELPGSILYELEILQSLSIKVDDRQMDDDFFYGLCESLIQHLSYLLSQDEFSSLLVEKAKDFHKPGTENCWEGLRHSAGRLTSYLHATKLLTIARDYWPSLAKRFEVRFIGSSVPSPNPFEHRGDIIAEVIIEKITGDMQLKRDLQTIARELQKEGLDGVMQKVTQSPSFKPQVHAEILSWQSIEKEGLISPMHFFENDMYIGSSKPTCQLCHWYFEQHHEVEVRPTHHNLYIKWKLPDIYQIDTSVDLQGAISKREEKMKSMIDSVRSEVLRLLHEKAPRGKIHDSNTSPTFPVPSLGDLDLEDPDNTEQPDCGIVLERTRTPYALNYYQ